jgi:hypothetical protein
MARWIQRYTTHAPRSCACWVLQPIYRSIYQEGGDSAQNYFKRTEMIAGVQDMRFQVSE